jgi:septum formation protein
MRGMSLALPAAVPLVLASTSRYRRELLERLRLPFEVLPPNVDESPQPAEAPSALALRLALHKARAVALLRPQAVVIGADQVAELDGQAIGKPGSHERAVAQLQRLRGREVLFHSGLAVVRPSTAFEAARVVPVRVQFRALSDADIEAYLRAEPAYDCAGSAKCEGLGITLLHAIHSSDPTALIGLPLIELTTLLLAAGIKPLAAT